VIRRAIALGGPPGSGKTTAGRLVARTLGLDYRSAGELFRAEAARRGLTLEAFGAFASSHPEVDRELDRTMQALAAPGRLLEGRIQGALLRRAGVPSYWIGLTADEAERARRVAARDQLSQEAALRAIREREAVENDRYRRFYGIDVDREQPDLLLDSTSVPPEALADAIVRFVVDREAKEVR
jgi:CMP/dCMP kinase